MSFLLVLIFQVVLLLILVADIVVYILFLADFYYLPFRIASYLRVVFFILNIRCVIVESLLIDFPILVTTSLLMFMF